MIQQSRWLLLVISVVGLHCLFVHDALAQENVSRTNTAALPPGASEDQAGLPTVWDLAVQGGWFMIPIGLASIITLAFTLERLVALRRGRIIPGRTVRDLRTLLSSGSVEPRALWQVATARSSPLSRALQTAVLKTGRPQAELEKSVEDSVQREALRMARNIRPVNIVAGIAPLLGLLGTVQGMILAFMVTSTTSSTGTAKAQELATGIYTALVTTFAGLSVAVISVILAHFLEGRIERLLGRLEGIFLDLLPRLERFEGRIRVVESSTAESGVQIVQLASVESAARGSSRSNSGGNAGTRKAAAARESQPVSRKT